MSVLSTTLGLLANQFLDMRCCIAGTETSGEIAISAFEFERSHGAGAGHGFQTWTCGPCSRASHLAVRVGEELLLVEIHLPLDFVLSATVRARRYWALRAVGPSDWCCCCAGVWGCKVCGMEAWERGQSEMDGRAGIAGVTGTESWSTVGLRGNSQRVSPGRKRRAHRGHGAIGWA